MKVLLLSITLTTLAVFFAHADESTGGRWYSADQVKQGQQVFQQNCARCHGSEAQGAANWRQRQADGSYPPPPLNGSAHAWHHPMPVLMNTINRGGQPFGGKMPAFGNILSKEEKLAVIAYFQHYWPDEIYRVWLNRHRLPAAGTKN